MFLPPEGTEPEVQGLGEANPREEDFLFSVGFLLICAESSKS